MMQTHRMSAALLLVLTLTGCGIEPALSGRAYDEYQKSIKAYGDYWVKEGMTEESRREDWVACGGRANGAYSSDAPSGSTNEVLSIADVKKRKALGDCMSAKGYRYAKQ